MDIDGAGNKSPRTKESNEELLFFSMADLMGFIFYHIGQILPRSAEVSQPVHIVFQTILVTSSTLHP